MAMIYPKDAYQASYKEINKVIMEIFERTGWKHLTGDNAWVHQAAIVKLVKEFMPKKLEWSITRRIRKMAQDGILESGFYSGIKNCRGKFRWGGELNG